MTFLSSVALRSSRIPPTGRSGYVRLEEDSSWGASSDTARLLTRLLGRERLLTMTITAFEPNRLVTYMSKQPGLPDASHERHFEPDGAGFVYRLVVDYAPRGGIAGLFDRFLLARGVRRAFQRTFIALEQEFASSQDESPCCSAGPLIQTVVKTGTSRATHPPHKLCRAAAGRSRSQPVRASRKRPLQPVIPGRSRL